LLAKDRAVEPLLEALADADRAGARPELVGVLVGLLVRVGDPRITKALADHFRFDPDPAVRAAIARAMGLYRRADLLEALLEFGLADADGDVKHQTLQALGSLAPEMTPQQHQHLLDAAIRLMSDPHVGVATEARILAAGQVADLVDAGRALHLRAEVARAESLYLEALRRVPDSHYANYRLGRLRFDRGDREAGLAVLRAHDMALDVPRLDEAPVLDGRLEEAVWSRTARADQLYSYVSSHVAAVPAAVGSRFHIGYDDEALYIGFVGFDEHPDSLLAFVVDRDTDQWWREDVVEIFMDADLDHQSYAHLGFNSLGTAADAWHTGGVEDRNVDWDTDIEVAAHVGAADWSLEVAIRFSEPHLSPPAPGAIWGFNFVRVYRGAEFSQWVRTFARGGHSPDDFGFLVFGGRRP
jgi:hypothetical protein